MNDLRDTDNLGLFVCLFVFFETRSYCSTGWPQICHAIKDDLELLVLLPVQGAGITVPQYHTLFLCGLGWWSPELPVRQASTLPTELYL